MMDGAASIAGKYSDGGRREPLRRRQRSSTGLCASACRIRELSTDVWGRKGAVEIVGQSPRFVDLLKRLEKIARYQEPVLIVGESGVGKELIAQALYLLSPRIRKPYVSVSCPQYQEGSLTVSELFGHTKGSFTGALAARKGCFETAEEGVIFLDEIGDLHMSAQVMLLRALATGEFQPLGGDRSRQMDVRVLAATNRPLNQLAADQEFRRDLLFRLRAFQVEVLPLCEREDDWRLLIEHFLGRLHRQYGVEKRFSPQSLSLLEAYSWPGNVRELKGLVTMGYALADGEVIEPADFIDALEHDGYSAENRLEALFHRLGNRQGSFWDLVQQPFLDRDLNRCEVRWLIGRGLRTSQGCYRRLLELWSVSPDQYQKFMDFLRHHRLKPTAFGDDAR